MRLLRHDRRRGHFRYRAWMADTYFGNYLPQIEPMFVILVPVFCAKTLTASYLAAMCP